MSAGHRVRSIAACGLVAIAWAAPTRADEPSDEEKAKLQRQERQFQESLGWYQVSATPAPEPAMKPRAVLRWTNATRGQKGEPTLILWTEAGRPEALASVYPWSGNLIYECVSLARDPGLTAREGARTVWSPTRPGVTFRDVPDAPTPAETPVARLAQARAISERFKASILDVHAGVRRNEELRLLPKPIYRYDLGEAKGSHPELIDGAVFAFVQGTDPEAVILVEAVRRGELATWQYAFGRATGYGVEAKLGPTVVWSVAADFDRGPKNPSLVLGRPLVK